MRDDYSGAGGWSEGLRLLGLEDYGIEWDRDACRTRAAAGHATIRADLSTYRPAGTPAGYIASPPCQTFSTAGNGDGRAVLDELVAAVHAEDWGAADRYDAKTRHVLDAARTAATCGAEWVCLEQVPAVLPIWVAVGHVLERAGYRVWTGVLNAADYGVPQTRRRAILIASQTRRVGPPPPSHTETPVPVLFGQVLMPWVSWGEALDVDGQVELETDRGKGMTERHGPRRSRPTGEPAQTIRAGLGGIGTGLRMTPSTMPNAAIRHDTEPAPTVKFGHAAAGWTIQPAPRIELRQGRTVNGERVDVRDIPTIEPAPTFATNSGYQWIMHGCQPTRLTTAQAATLQSFRADYPWQGTKTSTFAQIGNAIPPLLAAHIVAAATGTELVLT